MFVTSQVDPRETGRTLKSTYVEKTPITVFLK